MLFCTISLQSLHATTCFMFCGGREQGNDFLFLFLNFNTACQNSTPEKIANV